MHPSLLWLWLLLLLLMPGLLLLLLLDAAQLCIRRDNWCSSTRTAAVWALPMLPSCQSCLRLLFIRLCSTCSPSSILLCASCIALRASCSGLRAISAICWCRGLDGTNGSQQQLCVCRLLAGLQAAPSELCQALQLGQTALQVVSSLRKHNMPASLTICCVLLGTVCSAEYIVFCALHAVRV